MGGLGGAPRRSVARKGGYLHMHQRKWFTVAATVVLVALWQPGARAQRWTRALQGATVSATRAAQGNGTAAMAVSVTMGSSDRPWLVGVPPAVHCGGTWFSAAVPEDSTDSDSSAAPSGPRAPRPRGASGAVQPLTWLWDNATNGTAPEGLPQLGPCDALSTTWAMRRSGARAGARDGGAAATWVTAVYVCGGAGAVVFEQRWPQGCGGSNATTRPGNGTSRRPWDQFMSPVAPLSEFPAFSAAVPLNCSASTAAAALTDANATGHVSWFGTHAFNGGFGGAGLRQYTGGTQGGPVLLHNISRGADPADTLVLSPLDEFSTGVFGRRAPCRRARGEAPACRALLPDVDVDGNDLYSVGNVSGMAACCAACAGDSRCVAVSFSAQRSTCYLKSSAAGAQPRNGTTAGLMCGVALQRERGGGGGGCAVSQEVLAGGVRSDVASLARGYALRLVLVPRSAAGVNAGMAAWGDVLRSAHNTTRLPRSADTITSKLGVWTDNGAYSYGGGNKPTTASLTALFASLRRAQVPVRYLQLDPWWYHDTWTPGAMLPGGFPALRKAVGVPLLLYSNMWTTRTPAAYNGTWPFDDALTYYSHDSLRQFTQVRPSAAADFYRAIMAPYAPLMAGFEVDFMNYEAALWPAWTARTGAGEEWMRGFAEAALRNGVAVQLCMALPAQAMAALPLPAVTNMRASRDDFPADFDGYGGTDRYLIAYTSLLLWPLRLRPFMDVLWTTAAQPGNPYNVSRRHNVELVAAAAALSAGPFGIGDGPGMTNASLVGYVADADGSLVQPSAPATPVDAMYLPAGRAERPAAAAQVIHAHSLVPGVRAAFYSVLAVSVVPPFALLPRHLFPLPAAGDAFVAFALSRTARGSCANGTAASACVVPFAAAQPLVLDTAAPRGIDLSHELWSASPLLRGGFALLGDLRKFVAASPLRFAGVGFSSDDAAELVVNVTAAAGQRVEVTAIVPRAARTKQARNAAGVDEQRAAAAGAGEAVGAAEAVEAGVVVTQAVVLPPSGAAQLRFPRLP